MSITVVLQTKIALKSIAKTGSPYEKPLVIIEASIALSQPAIFLNRLMDWSFIFAFLSCRRLIAIWCITIFFPYS